MTCWPTLLYSNWRYCRSTELVTARKFATHRGLLAATADIHTSRILLYCKLRLNKVHLIFTLEHFLRPTIRASYFLRPRKFTTHRGLQLLVNTLRFQPCRVPESSSNTPSGVPTPSAEAKVASGLPMPAHFANTNLHKDKHRDQPQSYLKLLNSRLTPIKLLNSPLPQSSHTSHSP